MLVKASVTLLCDAADESALLITLYACFTQSEQVMYVGRPVASPDTTCGSVAMMLFRLRVPSTLSICVNKSVTQSVLLLVLRIPEDGTLANQSMTYR